MSRVFFHVRKRMFYSLGYLFRIFFPSISKTSLLLKLLTVWVFKPSFPPKEFTFFHLCDLFTWCRFDKFGLSTHFYQKIYDGPWVLMEPRKYICLCNGMWGTNSQGPDLLSDRKREDIGVHESSQLWIIPKHLFRIFLVTWEKPRLQVLLKAFSLSKDIIPNGWLLGNQALDPIEKMHTPPISCKERRRTGNSFDHQWHHRV